MPGNGKKKSLLKDKEEKKFFGSAEFIKAIRERLKKLKETK